MGFEPIYDRPYEDRELPGYSIPRRSRRDLHPQPLARQASDLLIDLWLHYLFTGERNRTSNLLVWTELLYHFCWATPVCISLSLQSHASTYLTVYVPVQAEVRPAFAVGLVFWHEQSWTANLFYVEEIFCHWTTCHRLFVPLHAAFWPNDCDQVT